MAGPAPTTPLANLTVALLGPVEVARDGAVLAISGAKPRALLALLALRANAVVSADRLVEALWPGEDSFAEGPADPARLANLLQVNVRTLRKVIEPDPGARPVRLLTQQPGYRLVLDDDELDVDGFERDVADARLARKSGDVATAVSGYTSALARWRGAALDDLAAQEWARADAVRLDESRLAAVEELADLRLMRGEHAPLVPELEALVREHPLREHVHAQLLLALYRSGRQADALRAYQDARDTLLDELGIDPGPELRQLEAAILQQDDTLVLGERAPGWSSAAPAGTAEVDSENAPPTTSIIAPAPLPHPTSALVDRLEESARLAALLDDPTHRLVTITGPGGVGKTRLAVEMARRTADEGRVVAFCELDELSDATLVVPAIAAALGVEERNQESIAATIARSLSGATPLVVLDNLEHLLAARAALADLLTATSLQLLVTSRTALGLSAESDLALAPLAAGTSDVPGPAVILLRERATAVNSAYEHADPAALVALCDRMDGLPLAIELAAPLARVFDAAELVARWDEIEHEPVALGANDDFRPERQRTIGGAAVWSLSLLDDTTRDAAMALAVFRGAFTVDDAEAVLARADTVGALTTLREHSLLLPGRSDRPGRFRFLRSMRRCLDDERARRWDAEADGAVRQRHAARIAARLAAVGEDANFDSVDQDDARAALDTALDRGDIELATRIVAARITPWIRTQSFSEAGAALSRALDLCSGTPPPALDAAAGSLAEARDDFLAARLHLERAHKGFEAAGDTAAAVDIVTELAGVAMLQGEFERVDELLDHARSVASPDGAEIARFADYVEAWLAEERGDLARARAGFEAHVDAARLLGRNDEAAYALVTLAELETLDGNEVRAVALLDEADALHAPGRSAQLDCYRARLHGMLALAAGNASDAAAAYSQALDCAVELGRACELSWCIDGIAACAATDSRDEDAAILFGAAAALRERAGAATPRTEREVYSALRASAVAGLGESRHKRLATLARRLSVDDAVVRARRALAQGFE